MLDAERMVVNLHHLSAPLPADVVRCDRRTPRGNPFVVGERIHHNGRHVEISRDLACDLFAVWAETSQDPAAVWIRAHSYELIGKRCGCWCAPERCHCLTLVGLADRTCSLCHEIFPTVDDIDPENLHRCAGCANQLTFEGTT